MLLEVTIFVKEFQMSSHPSQKTYQTVCVAAYALERSPFAAELFPSRLMALNTGSLSSLEDIMVFALRDPSVPHPDWIPSLCGIAAVL